MNTKIAALIPARMASSRFPGKPLLDVAGLPMVEHVRRRALLCPEFSDVAVATCDREIADVVQKFGGRVILTSDKHRVATERLVEAMEKLDCTHVVNVQGDEMLILPSDLTRMARAIQARPENLVWNAVAPVDTAEELTDTSWVKCALTRENRFLFCARNFSFLPFKGTCFEPVYKVIGILAYHRLFLSRFHEFEPTPIEKMESIEQLRFLEYGIPIEAVPFEKGFVGVNVPREAEMVQKILKEDPTQKEILQKILEL